MVDESVSDLHQQEWAVAETLTTQMANRLRAHDLVVEVLLREGRSAEVILEQTGALSADLIAIGAKGLSARDEFRLGATAHKLAHYADCAVLVIRSPERAQLLSAIFAPDGSPEAQRAVQFLYALSLPNWAEVTVLSMAEGQDLAVRGTYSDDHLDTGDMEESLRQAFLEAGQTHADQAVERLQACGFQVGGVSRIGYPARAILRAAQEQDADLIAVGARGRTRAGPSRMGDVARKIGKYASCSVLVVR